MSVEKSIQKQTSRIAFQIRVRTRHIFWSTKGSFIKETSEKLRLKLLTSTHYCISGKNRLLIAQIMNTRCCRQISEDGLVLSNVRFGKEPGLQLRCMWAKFSLSFDTLFYFFLLSCYGGANLAHQWIQLRIISLFQKKRSNLSGSSVSGLIFYVQCATYVM